MNVLHYLNVAIGFCLVMLLLSIVTGFVAQAWLTTFRTKARAVGRGLTNILVDIGVGKEDANLTVDELLDKDPSIFGERLTRLLQKIRVRFHAGAPKNIGREEFFLLLLRRAATNNALAEKLGLKNGEGARSTLVAIERKILEAEAATPARAAQLWRTEAITLEAPELASKIFARFDYVIDRVTDGLSTFGKGLSIVFTLPILLLFWPVDAFELFNRMNSDQVLSAKVAGIADASVPTLQAAQKELMECQSRNPGKPEECSAKSKVLDKIATDMMTDLDSIAGLFGKPPEKRTANECLSSMFSRNPEKKDMNGTPSTFSGKSEEKEQPNADLSSHDGCHIAKPTPGILVTWILVSLGSAFWLGLLNKIMGIRSEFSKKLESEREFRATSQA
jgi:hypothetical protein